LDLRARTLLFLALNFAFAVGYGELFRPFLLAQKQNLTNTIARIATITVFLSKAYLSAHINANFLDTGTR